VQVYKAVDSGKHKRGSRVAVHERKAKRNL